MIYQDARVDIQSGDLLAWSGRSAIGRFIRSWTGGTASHVGVAWVVAGRVLVLEAREGRGVTVRPLSRALPAIWGPAGRTLAGSPGNPGAGAARRTLFLLGRPPRRPRAPALLPWLAMR